MHICIIGTGVSGLMTACELLKLNFVDKISIIGSSKIPSIKVGESTTHTFYEFVKNNFDVKKFVQETDAAVKYGVYYENWSKRDFIHAFGGNQPYLRESTVERAYCQLLANKSPDTHIHDLIVGDMWNFIRENKVSLDADEYVHSWHFDAGKFKIFLKNHLKKNEKVEFFDDTVADCKFLVKEEIEYIIGESKTKYTADYFVNCCGDNDVNEKIFKEEYVSAKQYLLTNKAVVYPLKYKNKEKEFHPYTVAKTMKNGWRWITPTQSRIGTGYVFSDEHISVDEATNEFLEDIGDKTLEPFVVDFNPRNNKKQFKVNNCTIGMSSGFLEPLDAPGLAFTNGGIKNLIEMLEKINQMKNENIYTKKVQILKKCKDLNFSAEIGYQWWCCFILHQYKTCWRSDTQFWIDHKNVKCDFYDKIIETLYYVPTNLFERHEYEMLFKTTAGKDIQWNTKITEKPFLIKNLNTTTVHHLDYIQSFYD